MTMTPREADALRQSYFEHEYEYMCTVVDRFLSQREGGYSKGNYKVAPPGTWQLCLTEENGLRHANQTVVDRVVRDYTAAGWLVEAAFDVITFSVPPSEEAS